MLNVALAASAIKRTLRPHMSRFVAFILARPGLTRYLMPLVKASPFIFNRLKAFAAHRGLANPALAEGSGSDIAPPSARVQAVHATLKKGFADKERG